MHLLRFSVLNQVSVASPHLFEYVVKHLGYVLDPKLKTEWRNGTAEVRKRKQVGRWGINGSGCTCELFDRSSEMGIGAPEQCGEAPTAAYN